MSHIYINFLNSSLSKYKAVLELPFLPMERGLSSLPSYFLHFLPIIIRAMVLLQIIF